MFEDAGYETHAPAWPGDTATVEEGKANPGSFAGHTVGEIVGRLEEEVERIGGRPILVGHSFGGCFVQMLAGRGLATASVSISPAPYRGILALPPSSIRAALPVLRNPLNRRRAVTLTPDQFRYAFANAVSEEEARTLYDRFHVPGSGAPIHQASNANLNPATELKVDTEHPQRGPMIILSGDSDHTVPTAIAKASFKKQQRNSAATEFDEIANRGHSLTIDSGWREVADRALAFAQRHAPPG